MGVANKEMVRLQPTVKCLVNLTESPAFLLDLDVIEHVHFERVNYGGGKNFDVVFINKVSWVYYYYYCYYDYYYYYYYGTTTTPLLLLLHYYYYYSTTTTPDSPPSSVFINKGL